ncbi:MAG: reprolysin-like metallopeptidase, partial [Chloroflexota bacterium]
MSKRPSMRKYLSALRWIMVIILSGLIIYLGQWLFTPYDNVQASSPPESTPEPSPVAAMNNSIWQDVDETLIHQRGGGSIRMIIPKKYRVVTADMTQLDQRLAQAPFEGTTAARNVQIILPIPLPDGRIQRFHIEEYGLLDTAFAKKRPDIKTYRGQGIGDPTAVIWLDRTPAGFHGMILSAAGTVYIDPYQRRDIETYISYYRRDYDNIWGKQMREAALDSAVSNLGDSTDADRPPATAEQRSLTGTGPTLRTYRLAVAATSQYTAFHTDVAGAQAAIATTILRVNGIYEREVAVRFTLIENSGIIFDDVGSDPYNGLSASQMLTQNQATLDFVLGSAAYDIGHVFDTDSSGLAVLGAVCDSIFKARGTTGISPPVGDPFDVDYVSHEIGHQFNAQHTFNANNASSCSNGTRAADTAYEPGGGSTIMAYAGICGFQNLQSNSDDYFHAASLEEIASFVSNPVTGGSCGTQAATGNTAPNAEAGLDYTIPKQTPFSLLGSATDTVTQTLTYNWEEFDLGAPWSGNNFFSLPNTDVDAARPIFRSFPPVTETVRTFPMISSIFDKTYQNFGEVLPAITRTMAFKLTVRDGEGGVGQDMAHVTVDGASGPFRVTSPLGSTNWGTVSVQTVTWDVANTDQPPVNCATVDISFTIDQGQSFTPLKLSTPNDGAETLILLGVLAPNAAIKIACTDNIFFDMSDDNLDICDLEMSGGGLVCAETASPYVDLTIVKSVSAAVVPAGQPLTYTLRVQNQGNLTATDLLITDTVPVSTTYVSGSASEEGQIAGSLVSWQPASVLAPGSTITRTFVVTVSSRGAITNMAYVSATNALLTVGSNVVTTHVPLSQTNLQLTKLVSDLNVEQGDWLTYTITVFNNGFDTAKNIVIRDVVPPQTTYIDGSATDGGIISGNIVIWQTNGDLAFGASLTRTFAVTATQAGVITNVASISATNIPVVQYSNIVSTVVEAIPIPQPLLTLVKSASTLEASVGDVVTYSLAAHNISDTTAQNIRLTDTIPLNTQYVSGSADFAGTASLSNTLISWHTGLDLAAGQSLTRTFAVMVGQAALIINTGYLSASNISQIVESNVVAVTVLTPNLTLAKSASATQIQSGQQITYTLIAKNVGLGTARNIVLRDAVPES